jgi:cytochrome c-type biogenesis protein
VVALDVGYAVAFGGGILSFASPCVLPLVPAYLTIVSGVDPVELRDGGVGVASRVVSRTLLFVLGFGVVFVALGLTASAIGRSLVAHRVLLERLGGVVLLVMAGVLALSVLGRLPMLSAEKRWHPNLRRFGRFAAPVAGMAFALGWTPCIGPILASVFAVAATQGQLLQGALLLAAYSLGLGVPFLLFGLAFTKALALSRILKRYGRAVTLVAAGVLVVFGVVMVSNDFSWITLHLQALANHLGLSALNRLG